VLLWCVRSVGMHGGLQSSSFSYVLAAAVKTRRVVLQS